MKKCFRQLLAALLCTLIMACGTEAEPELEVESVSVEHDTPFAVGSSTRFIHDDSRPYDSVAGINTGVRTLITEVWYPVDHQDVEPGQTNYRYATYGDYVFGNRAVHRLIDLRATLAELDRMNVNGTFADRLDLERIGLFGRSYGGTTTIMGLSMEPRFSAGFSVVPPGFPDSRPVLPPEILAASGQESVMLSADGPFPLTEIKKPMFLMSDAEDGLIIGHSMAMASSYGTTMPKQDNPHPLLREAHEASPAPVIWGLLADSNHSTLGVSGGYWWPELKPDRQKRTFEPEVEFKLMSPKLAQKIQRELALDFFDLTIKQMPSAKQRLLDQRFADHGLRLEARNF